MGGAGFFTLDILGFGGFAAAAIAEVIPKLAARGVTRVIDVGCGAGVTTKALLEAGFETRCRAVSRLARLHARGRA